VSSSPSLNLYVDKRTQKWCVSVFFSKPRFRVRQTLGVPATEDAAEAFEAFKSEQLPGIIRDYIERPPEHQEKPQQAPGARIRDVIDWYINSHLPFLGREPRTIERYDQILRDFELYCRAHHIGRVSQISWARIEEWQKWMAEHRPAKNGYGRSQISKRDEVSVVRRMFTAAEETQKIDRSPVVKWFIPKVKKQSKYKALSFEQLRELLRLVDQYEPVIAPVVHWLALTGWRMEDVLDLRWKEVDLKRGVIDRMQLKVNDTLDYPLTPALRVILDRVPLSTGDTLVFPLPVGASERTLASKRSIYVHRHLTRMCERVENFPRVIPRDLRKTFCTLMASGAMHPQGIPCPPKVLQHLAGHKKVETTLDYYIETDLVGMSTWSNFFTSALDKTTENHVSHAAAEEKADK
jgi:integrase